MTTHGRSKSRVYRIWDSMLSRCKNPNHTSYHRYGGRGVRVAERWLKFESFFEDMGEPPTSKHTLDRRDNSKGYEPENCRWATRSEQQRNRVSNVHLSAFGEVKLLIEWVEDPRCEVSYGTVRARLRRGWSPEEAIFTRPRCRRISRRNGCVEIHFTLRLVTAA